MLTLKPSFVYPLDFSSDIAKESSDTFQSFPSAMAFFSNLYVLIHYTPKQNSVV